MHVRITSPQDLHMLSSHLQDALAPRSLMSLDEKSKEFSMVLNRYIWENNTQQRTNCCIKFCHVTKVLTQSIDHELQQRILNLLAIRYDGNRIVCYFSDHRSLAIEFDRLEIDFWDYDNAWPVNSMPKHVHEYSQQQL